MLVSEIGFDVFMMAVYPSAEFLGITYPELQKENLNLIISIRIREIYHSSISIAIVDKESQGIIAPTFIQKDAHKFIKVSLIIKEIAVYFIFRHIFFIFFIIYNLLFKILESHFKAIKNFLYISDAKNSIQQLSLLRLIFLPIIFLATLPLSILLDSLVLFFVSIYYIGTYLHSYKSFILSSSYTKPLTPFQTLTYQQRADLYNKKVEDLYKNTVKRNSIESSNP